MIMIRYRASGLDSRGVVVIMVVVYPYYSFLSAPLKMCQLCVNSSIPAYMKAMLLGDSGGTSLVEYHMSTATHALRKPQMHCSAGAIFRGQTSSLQGLALRNE